MARLAKITINQYREFMRRMPDPCPEVCKSGRFLLPYPVDQAAIEYKDGEEYPVSAIAGIDYTEWVLVKFNTGLFGKSATMYYWVFGGYIEETKPWLHAKGYDYHDQMHMIEECIIQLRNCRIMTHKNFEQLLKFFD